MKCDKCEKTILVSILYKPKEAGVYTHACLDCMGFRTKRTEARHDIVSVYNPQSVQNKSGE